MNKLKVIFNIAVIATLLVLVERLVSTEAIQQAFLDLQPISIIFSLLLFIIMEGLIALRWRLIARCLRIDLSYWQCVKLIFEGHFFNQILPSTISGDAYRVLKIQKQGFSVINGTTSVLLDRFSGLLALLLIGGLSFLFGGHMRLIVFPEGIVKWWAPVLLASITVLVLLGFWKGAFLLDVFRQKLVSRLDLSLFERSPAPMVIVLIMLLSLVSQLFPILIFYTIIMVNFDPIPFAFLSFIVPISLIISLLPISIAGWGVREAFLSSIMLFYGYPGQVGFLAGFLFGCINLLAGIAGGISILLSKRVLSR